MVESFRVKAGQTEFSPVGTCIENPTGRILVLLGGFNNLECRIAKSFSVSYFHHSP